MPFEHREAKVPGHRFLQRKADLVIRQPDRRRQEAGLRSVSLAQRLGVTLNDEVRKELYILINSNSRAGVRWSWK